MTKIPPTRPQLVRFKRRINKAMDGIESARNWLRDAAEVFDGDQLPVSHPFAMAHIEAEHAANVLDAASHLLASSLTEAENPGALLPPIDRKGAPS